MNEEQAVFELGAKFSKMRHIGEDLPLSKVQVGKSYVSPVDLADEYDKHHPPGPKAPKLATTRRIRYELSYIEGSDRPEEFGLVFWIEDRRQDILARSRLFSGTFRHAETKITSTPDNRYDIIDGSMKLVIDKVEEQISVLSASMGYGWEVPVMGSETRWLRQDEWGCHDPVYFPFVPFGRFWDTWNCYQKERLRQIDELRNIKTPGGLL
jgi:hypothetical protein